MTQPANKRARSRVGCLLAMVALWPVLAFGQSSPIGMGGNGLKVGEGRLHPTFDLEMRVDSAAGYFPPPGNTTPGVVTDTLSGEALLHIRPGFVLELPGSTVSVDLKGYVDYVHYTGLLTPGSTAVSHIEGLGDLKLTFNRESPVSVEVGDHFERSDRTTSAAIGAGVLSLFNEARLAVPLRPGGGALEVTPQVSWGVELFKPLGGLAPIGCDNAPVCDPTQVNGFDYSNLRASLQGRWRFLPKTAVVVDAQFNYRSYFQERTDPALLLHATAGVAGLVTPKISVTAKAGWGKDFGTAQGSTLLAQLEGTYLMSQTASIKVGYARALEPVATFGLFRDDRGYLEGQALLGGRLTVRGTTSLDFLSFGNASPRKDTLFRLDVGPHYQFERWLIGGVGYLLAIRESSASGTGINYSRHEGYLRVTVTY
ncbi:hypothetical protein JRI60_38705 [Archangium violaceum]|uniref:hypothetical protein n=1 Tax=Archangium violaceum TaxID=83451 RepID=UPI00194FEB13|nr:hypothetical protein [Archangium violaceum]QRN94982.1 hypothetical protein JRI60_38705 [Archangium violaceum]